MKNRLSIILVSVMVILLSTRTIAQSISPSVSNLLRYGDGKRGSTSFDQRFSYFENLTDVRFNFEPSVVVGLRLLLDQPPEIGPRFQGLRRRFIEFNKDGVSIRAGHFSNLFGRGLTLNLFENRGLAFDTWVDGVKAGYRTNDFNISLVGGTLDFRDSITFARNERYKLIGGNGEFRLAKELSLGITFLSAEGVLPQAITIKNIKADLSEVYANVDLEDFHALFNWSRKWTNVLDDKTTSAGTGFYSSLSYASAGFGITVDYKNYQFDVRDPFERNDFTRATRSLPFQNPPIVQKEHVYTLLTRPIHEVDFNDEVGLQLEAYYIASEVTTVTVNASLASRHDYFDFNGATFVFTKRERVADVLPTFDQALSPFSEIFIELEHYFQEHSALRLGLAQREKTFFNEFTSITTSHIVSSAVIPVQVQYAVTPVYSVTIQSEHEWMNDNYNADQKRFYNQLITLIGSRSPDLSLAVRYEFTTNKYDPSGRKSWIAGEVGHHLGQSHTFIISYGRERGGLVCSNGVCRYIQPFVGVRLSLQSQI